MNTIAPDYPDESDHDNANAAHDVLSTTPPGGPDDDPSGTPPAAPAAAPPAVDHHAAVAAAMPEGERDMLAARIIASGGVEGVDLAISGDNAQEFAGHVSAIQSELQAVADQHVKAQGIDPDALYDYMRGRGAGVVRSTALTLYHGRNPAMALDPIIAEFRRTPTGRRA
jgi:hypothetical protein